MKPLVITLAFLACAPMAQAGLIVTSSLVEVAAFQQGLSVETFESVSGREPAVAKGYPSNPFRLRSEALVNDEVSGFRFMGDIKPDLPKAGLMQVGPSEGRNTMLVGLDDHNRAHFSQDQELNALLTTKVSSLGFWVNPELGRVMVYFASAHPLFAGTDTPELLDFVEVEAGQFVGLSRDSADIGALQIRALSARGFAIDDLSFGGTGSAHPIPEPASAWLVAAGLLAGASASRRPRRRAHAFLRPSTSARG